jgi:hypothetical protein
MEHPVLGHLQEVVQVQQVLKGLLGRILKSFFHLLLLSFLVGSEFNLFMKET